MKWLSDITKESFEYVRRNKFKTIIVLITMVLAYGFYVSSYTLNVDDVFTSFWNGGRLVAAGRFTGYLVQQLTGIMTYSPFFTMFLGLVIFFVAGLVFSMVLYLASGKKMSDNALFVFWIVFLTYPIISEQMVYPIIVLLALGYLFVALSVYLLDVFFREKKISALVTSVILMILYIDFYEAFVTVFLALMMAVILVKFIYSSEESDKKVSKILLTMIKFVVALVVAIAIRMIFSKVFLFAFYGTTQAGYSGNNSVYWTQLGIIDCAIWLIRTVFYRYFWAAVDYLPIFLFVASVVCGIVLSIILTVKKKSAVPVLAFLFMIAGALSLNVLMGIATGYTMAQSLALVVAFTVMLLFVMTEGKKVEKRIVSICICLLVLNQAKSLNEWSVVNYERYDYEISIVDDVSRELKNYSIDEKPVVFIGDEKISQLPEYFENKAESGLTLVKAAQKAFLKASDTVIPQRYFDSIIEFYGLDGEGAQALYDGVKKSRNGSSANYAYIGWCICGESWFTAYDKTSGYGDTTYSLFESRGCELIRCTKEEYDAVCNKVSIYPSYPDSGYITETDKCIVVNFG